MDQNPLTKKFVANAIIIGISFIFVFAFIVLMASGFGKDDDTFLNKANTNVESIESMGDNFSNSKQ